VKKSIIRPFFQFARVTAMAAVVLAGCDKSRAQQAAGELPEKVVLTEQTAAFVR
jgi:hypothetical protein